MSSTITYGELPAVIQTTIVVGLVLVALMILCILARIKWLLETIGCILCWCCPTRNNSYNAIEYK